MQKQWCINMTNSQHRITVVHIGSLLVSMTTKVHTGSLLLFYDFPPIRMESWMELFPNMQQPTIWKTFSPTARHANKKGSWFPPVSYFPFHYHFPFVNTRRVAKEINTIIKSVSSFHCVSNERQTPSHKVIFYPRHSLKLDSCLKFFSINSLQY